MHYQTDKEENKLTHRLSFPPVFLFFQRTTIHRTISTAPERTCAQTLIIFICAPEIYVQAKAQINIPGRKGSDKSKNIVAYGIKLQGTSTCREAQPNVIKCAIHQRIAGNHMKITNGVVIQG